MIAAETQGIATKGFATQDPESKFEPFDFARREPGPKGCTHRHRVLRHLSLGHSPGARRMGADDPVIYPMVPGHEIVGRVTKSATK